MRKSLIAGNWKMQGSRQSVSALIEGIKTASIDDNKVDFHKVEVAVFPPSIFIDQVARELAGTQIRWGAQNMSQEAAGAFTGEISADMLFDFGCYYVLVGHSERRSLYGENDEIVAKKVLAAHLAGLHPIFCVGETQAERDSGHTNDVIFRQLAAVLHMKEGIAALQDAVIAYEPVWAIGTGRTATPEQAQDVHAMIREKVARRDPELAEKIRILYGGSVKASNAANLFVMPDIDGALVGGASLDASEFITICRNL
jgi:triosephosphate isomerase (TIM)